MTPIELVTLLADIFLVLACILIAIGLTVAVYPIASGEICSWNAPCGLKKGYDCSKCEHKINKGEGILRTLIAMFSFGVFKG